MKFFSLLHKYKQAAKDLKWFREHYNALKTDNAKLKEQINKQKEEIDRLSKALNSILNIANDVLPN
jgi:chromosome segregation ATPase